MRILIPFPYVRAGGGGIVNFILHFSREAVKQGHDVTVLSTLEPGEKAREDKDSVHYIRIPMAKSTFLRRLRDYPRFARLARAQDLGTFDVVLGVSSAALAGIGMPLAYRSASGPIAWELAMWERLWKEGLAKANPLKKIAIRLDFALQKRMEAKCVSNAKALLCQSRAIANGFRDEYATEAPAHIPCTGVDTAQFSPGKSTLKKKLGVDGPLLLFAGGFSVPKGGSVLERALPVIFAKHPDAKLAIIGQESYKMLDDEKRVLHLGPVPHDELPAYYNAADVFVYPTVYNEGFPNVILEAMASGTPIVTTNIPGINEYLKNGVSALIVPQYDVHAFAAAVNRILDDKKLAESLAKHARTASMQFDWKTVTKGMLQFLEKVIAGTRK
jgi:glycosyltransferase involved in cell wall biosynthesis